MGGHVRAKSKTDAPSYRENEHHKGGRSQYKAGTVLNLHSPWRTHQHEHHLGAYEQRLRNAVWQRSAEQCIRPAFSESDSTRVHVHACDEHAQADGICTLLAAFTSIQGSSSRSLRTPTWLSYAAAWRGVEPYCGQHKEYVLP